MKESPFCESSVSTRWYIVVPVSGKVIVNRIARVTITTFEIFNSIIELIHISDF